MPVHATVRSCLVTLALLAVLAPAATARKGDWKVNIDTRVVDPCLSFPTSDLHPVIKASVRFLQRGPKKLNLQPTTYEDLYYSHCRVIGLRRHSNLEIKAGSQGDIFVGNASSDFRSEEACAAANAVVRLFLDLYRRKAPLASVVVPRDFFDTVVSELQRYGFRPSSGVVDQPIVALVMIHIASDPPGRTQDLLYGN